MPLLEVKGLTKYFGGLTAVNTLDFSVKKGEIVGLIGPNGAGKTTVFNLIMGTYPPSKGKILFKGKDITGQKSHTIVSRGLVRSFQKTILFGEMTVQDNLLLGGFWRWRKGQRDQAERIAPTTQALALGGLADGLRNPQPPAALSNRLQVGLY